MVQSELSTDKLARWLVKVRHMKYGKKALRRSERLSAQEVLASLRERCSGPWGLQEAASTPQYRSRTSGRTARDMARDTASSLALMPSGVSVSGLLCVAFAAGQRFTLRWYRYAFGMLGVLVDVRRSQAAIINPWLLQVSHVSSTREDTATHMCKLDAGLVTCWSECPLHSDCGGLGADR